MPKMFVTKDKGTYKKASCVIFWEAEVEVNTPEAVRGRKEVVADADSSMRKETTLVGDDELLDNIDFD
jgi:hypothetical protein